MSLKSNFLAAICGAGGIAVIGASLALSPAHAQTYAHDHWENARVEHARECRLQMDQLHHRIDRAVRRQGPQSYRVRMLRHRLERLRHECWREHH